MRKSFHPGAVVQEAGNATGFYDCSGLMMSGGRALPGMQEGGIQIGCLPVDDKPLVEGLASP